MSKRETDDDEGNAFERPKREGAGRPIELTPAKIASVVMALNDGAYIETAAALAGISKQTFYQWLKQGAKAEAGIFRQFSDAVQKAIADAEMNDLRTIKKASRKNWKAAAWRLERRFPSRWAPAKVQAHDDEGTTQQEGLRLSYALDDDDDESEESA